MKVKTTQSAIKANFAAVICVPYCELQTLLAYETPFAYTVRREGWAADIYDMGGGVAIATGYAPFGNIRPDYDLLKKYENDAKKIGEYYDFDYEKRKALLREAVREFVEAATGNK